MSDVFISYASEDRDRARMLAGILEERGISVWWDRKITPGQTYDKVIEAALHGAKCVVALWTADSVTSDWVKTEAAEAAQHNALVPAFLERVDPPLEFRRIQSADLIGWQGDTESPGLRNLINAVEQILGEHVDSIPVSQQRDAITTESDDAAATETAAATTESDSATKPPPPPSGQPAVGRGGNRWLLIGGGFAAVVVIAVVAALFLFAGGDGASACSGGDKSLTREEAEAKLGGFLVDCVQAAENFVEDGHPLRIFSAPLPELDDEKFPLTADPNPVPPDGVLVEVFVSTEKSGDETDGWMVEVADAFNAADIRLADGSPAKVAIRKISSGVAHEFIKAGRPPDAYSPSNRLWIDLATAEGVTMTPISEQLVPNLGGLIVESEKAVAIRERYGDLSASTLVDAVIAGDVVMAYTDPFVSSTGLNFLVTVLWELSGGEEGGMLSPDVQEKFQRFQQNVPFFAGDTLKLRDAVCSGRLELEALIMEHQTFVQATDCFSSGFEFIPFGIAHDNPLYAVGDLGEEKLEVLELFAQYTERPEFVDLANEYGFEPEPYTSSIPTLSGQTLIGSQVLWKDNKDAGEPVTAIFVTDVSGSMNDDVSTGGTRIQAVREALLTGIGFINDENYVGMVTFNHQVTHVLPVRPFDLDQKQLFTEAVETMPANGRTAMYDAIAVGLSLLLEEEVEREGTKLMLIVLTDGETTDGLVLDDIIGVIQGLGIPVHTIGFEADLAELERVSEVLEARNIDADAGNVAFEIARLLNAEA